jgi:hypothetical protein
MTITDDEVRIENLGVRHKLIGEKLVLLKKRQRERLRRDNFGVTNPEEKKCLEKAIALTEAQSLAYQHALDQALEIAGLPEARRKNGGLGWARRRSRN